MVNRLQQNLVHADPEVSSTGLLPSKCEQIRHPNPLGQEWADWAPYLVVAGLQLPKFFTMLLYADGS